VSAGDDREAPGIHLVKAVLLTIGAVGLLAGAVAFVGHAYREPLLALGRDFVGVTGRWGPALVFFVADAVTVPLPPDIFLALALVGGVGFWWIGLSASVASVAGGCLGYLIGNRLAHLPLIARYLQKQGAEADRLVRRYGVGAVAFAALTPFPYFIVCWTAGALKMPFKSFFATALLRFVRVFFYLWLIALGAVDLLA